MTSPFSLHATSNHERYCGVYPQKRSRSSHSLQTAPAGLDTSFNWGNGSSFLISLHSSLHLCCLAPRSNQSDLRTVPVRPLNLLKALCWLPAHSNTPTHGSLVSSSVRLLHTCSIHICPFIHSFRIEGNLVQESTFMETVSKEEELC